MPLFKKKTSLVHHITYMGIMTTINLIFVLLARFAPYFMFLLVIILPFASAVVSYFCLKRYFIIYAVASIGVCFIFGEPAETLFYVLPAILSGFVIGLLLEKKIHPFWMVLLSSLINAALTFAYIPLINLIINDNIVERMLVLFGLNDFAYKIELTYLFVCLVSFVQCILTNYVMMADIKKIGIETNTRIDSFYPYIIGLEVSVVLSLGLSFIYAPLGLFFAAVSLYFTAFLLVDLLLSKRVLIYILLVLSLLIFIILFAVFYQQIAKPFGIILVLIFATLISVLSFVNNYLLKRTSNI